MRRSRPVSNSFYLIGILCLVSCIGGARALADDSGLVDGLTHAGPAYDEFDPTLHTGHRTEIGGPFYYREQQETRRLWAVPPLLSYMADPRTDMEEWNFAYPVFTSIRYGQQFRIQLFQLLSFAGGPTQTEKVRNRFTLFPLFFQQHSSDPAENYVAYGPFYGHLKHRLFRDEIEYVMFPGYSRTRKGDVVTWNYLFPFFHVREGNSLKGWQFWPLYGEEHKGVTTRTNGFGDVETIGGHDERFVLWPIYKNRYSGIGTDNPKHEQTLLPAYYYLRSPLRDSTTVLWPFFTFIDDREKNYKERQTPWPFIDFARGPGKTLSRVWPFYSHGFTTNLESDSIMWPIYKHTRLHADPLDNRRTRIALFLYTSVDETNTQTKKSRSRKSLWPFFDQRRDFNGNERLQVIAPLETFLPENDNIQREYAPVYSFWRAEKNPTTGKSSQSLLWNLYRREKSPDRRYVSFFFGLYQSEKTPLGKRTRWFYLPRYRNAE